MAWNAQLLKIFAKICALAMLHRSYQPSSVNVTASRPSVCAKGSAAMGGFQTMLRRRRLCAESGKGRSQSTDAVMDHTASVTGRTGDDFACAA
jgi:hypothetical protein